MAAGDIRHDTHGSLVDNRTVVSCYQCVASSMARANATAKKCWIEAHSQCCIDRPRCAASMALYESRDFRGHCLR
jgi:hypothetical protein